MFVPDLASVPVLMNVPVPSEEVILSPLPCKSNVWLLVNTVPPVRFRSSQHPVAVVVMPALVTVKPVNEAEVVRNKPPVPMASVSSTVPLLKPVIELELLFQSRSLTVSVEALLELLSS